LAQEYARSPFVFITHPGVNKKNVTTQELEGFYSNPAASWPDGRRTRLILRPEKDIDSKLIRNLSPGMELALKAALERPGMILAVTDQESTDAVARTPGALGCTTLNEIISGNKKLNVLSFNGLESHAGTTANSFYPLIKTFYLVTTLKSSAEARQFAEFVRSPAAGRILKKTGHLAAAVK
jgi:phosphate transport system substrate-binding protein